MTNCQSLKGSLATFIERHSEVFAFENTCVVTLPLKTLDGRFTEVYVEEKLGNYCLVHDGGKTTSELFSQGVHVRDTKRAGLLKHLAECYGASFENGAFQISCRREEIQEAVFAISQCATLAMFDLLRNQPIVEDEPMASRVGRTLERWRPAGVDLKKQIHIRGNTPNADHVFDWVAFAREVKRRNVAVNVLTPTYSPELKAHSYGFLVKDIIGTEYEKWPRVAVLSKKERWDDEEVRLVRELSNITVEMTTDEVAELEERLPAAMEQAARIAA